MNVNQSRIKTEPRVGRADHTHTISEWVRYATVLLIPGPEGLHPGDKALCEESTVTQESIPHITLLNDGTVIMMVQLRGNLDRVKELLNANSAVIRSSVAEKGHGLYYVHSTAVDHINSLLLIPTRYKTMVDTSLEYTGEGNLRVTLIEEAKSSQEALSVLSDAFDLRLEKTGEYRPGVRDIALLLTDRQYHILDVAIKQGYYKFRRDSSLGDIADEVGLSVATVSEYLQKTKVKVFSWIAQ